MSESDLPAAPFYKIGEVAEMLHLKTHVLRFWETEFAQVKPWRTETGQRLYSEEDVNILRRIQYLLHEQGMTIEGAKRALEGNFCEEICPDNNQAQGDAEFLNFIQAELSDICKLLRNGAGL